MADYLTVERDPTQPVRTRRFMEKVALLLNGLTRSGQVTVSATTVTIAATAGGSDQQILASQIFGGRG